MKSIHYAGSDYLWTGVRASLRRFLMAAWTLGSGLLCAGVPGAIADDTEIFRASFDHESEGGRPKVLIMFDDSGSMDTIAEEKPAYDPSITYDTVSGIASGRLYWATGTSGNPPAADTGAWVYETKNRCATSYTPLANQGFYIDRLARWASSSSTSWADLSSGSSRRNPLHFDCSGDVVNSNNGNGAGTGAPGNGYPRSSTPRPYGSSRQTSVDDSWTSYRLYTANYMNWYHSTTVVPRTRLEVAQDVITSLISANPGVDFGLAVFNRNYDGTWSGSSAYDGGRIVRRIIEDMDESQRGQLVTIVDGLVAEGSTPLCESTYESYRYLAGKTVLYGLERSSSYDTPARDSAAESPSGTYASPAGECQYTYVILMTDGYPQMDTDANSRVETLTGKTCAKYLDADGDSTKNCLPEITEYMYTHDLDDDEDNGEQLAVTYTIGFTSDQALLGDAARRGGGLYYTANSADELANAFQGAITSILSSSSAFTAPSVAVDTFTRTESRNEVFFAMFEPQKGTDWPGNIKKLRISITGGEAKLKDADDVDAIDSDGKIADTARTYWSSVDDGSSVMKGGVGQLLIERDPDDREIWTNSGTSGALESFESGNVTAEKFGFADEAALLAAFGVASRAELDNLLDWARGWTDSTKSEVRSWILGDMLHSRPLVLNYGARGGHTQSAPDIRIVVGTNSGFLHMFDNEDGQESWAFFPKELASVLSHRFNNVAGGDTVWGIDGSAIIYSKDVNNDGTIDSGAGDKMYVYFGLRRGGRAYYALDVSDPDSPALLWKIDKSTAGFAELGQTWSVPVLTYMPGYAVSGVPKPVLVFGGGYDVSKDSRGDVAGDDTEGRGIYIVDAVTGAKVWSVTPAASTFLNMQASSLNRSIPAQVTVLDSNGDGLSDRIYAADTGGNIWRIDLSGNTRPTAAQDKWLITRLAALNTSASDGHAGDRRFFYPVDLVRTMSRRDGVFDAVLVGSGDRENPNALDNDDRFYMIRDRNTGIYSTSTPTEAECDGGSLDFRCDLPITDADLYDITDNLLQSGTDEEKSAAELALKAASGWYIDLEAADGEKALARSLTISGKVYFTTFAPEVNDDNICEPAAGTGRLYAVRLLDASSVIDFDGDGQLLKGDRLAPLGVLIPDTPAPHFGSDKHIRLLFPSGGGLQGMSNPFDTGAELRAPFGTYWYNEEY